MINAIIILLMFLAGIHFGAALSALFHPSKRNAIFGMIASLSHTAVALWLAVL